MGGAVLPKCYLDDLGVMPICLGDGRNFRFSIGICSDLNWSLVCLRAMIKDALRLICNIHEMDY
jgi:hypothetical protein